MTGDSIFVRNNSTVTLNTAVAGNMVNLNIGEDTGSGTLLVNAGGSVTFTGDLSVMRRNNQPGGPNGTLTVNSGSFTLAGATGSFAIGLATGSTANGTGTLNIAGTSRVSIGSATTLGSATNAGTGFINITGSQADITGTSLAVNAFGRIKFTLDSTGIADMVYSGAVSFASGSTITIDGTSFGGSAGNYTLIDAGTTLTGFGNINFSYTGFSPGYTPVVNFDSGTQSLVLNVTGVPEPSTYAMIGVGLAAVLFGLRRKCTA